MGYRLLTIALLFAATTIKAQDNEIIVLMPGVTTMEGLQEAIYLYPKFGTGVVTFKNGKNGKSTMNYCLVTSEMIFINSKGDTLALSGENDIDNITIGVDSFYYDGERFLRQRNNYGWIKTASFKSIRELERQKMGGYGESLSGSSVVSLNSINVSKNFIQLANYDKIRLLKETKYFIGNAKNEFVPLKEGEVMSLIPSAKKKVAYKYLKENKVNFKSITEVEAFLQAVNTL